MSGPRPALGFWVVAFGFLVFAIFAAGTSSTLLLEDRIAGRFGRRGVRADRLLKEQESLR